MDCSLPGSSLHGILQVRVLEWVAPFPSPGDLPDPGIKPGSPEFQADALTSEQLYLILHSMDFRKGLEKFSALNIVVGPD